MKRIQPITSYHGNEVLHTNAYSYMHPEDAKLIQDYQKIGNKAVQLFEKID